MKRLLLSVLPTLLLVPLAPAASPTYINNGIVNVLQPPDAAPVIDANNFVNRGYFAITNLEFFTAPFETCNTYNFTNFNQMFGSPGFRLDLFDSATSTRRMAANFANGTSIYDSNSTVYGSRYLLISATNVMNRGVLGIDATGLMRIEGKNVDLTHSSLLAVGNDANQLAGITDSYWGVGTNWYEGNYSASFVSSPYTDAETIQNQMYWPIFVTVALTNGFNAYITITPGFRTDYIVNAVFLANTNPAIATDVRFGFGSTYGSQKAIRWQSVVTNRFSGGLITNELYLVDTLAFGNPILIPNSFSFINGFSAVTYRPSNYQLTHAYPNFAGMTPIAPDAFDPLIMYGTNVDIIVTNSAYGATVTAQAFSPDPYVHGSTYSNLPGRIEVIADQVLNLANTHIDGQSFMRLNCTNHFAGNSNSTIFSPFTSLDLASTNDTLKISSLTAPTVPRMAGTLDCWSGYWTNGSPTLGSVMYNVTIVDSRLVTEVPSQIDELKLRAPNIVIADSMNVMRQMLLIGERLTIATNPPGAPTLTGELNLESSELLWSPSMPNLKYLTNYGRISASNSIYFGSTPVAPWSSGTYESPYNSFVNHGVVASAGNDTWANYFESSGTIDSGVGPLSIRAVAAIVTNGAFLAPQSDVTVSSASLVISNQVVQAGRAINLGVSDYLDDGSLNSSVEFITNRNFWTVRDGFNLLVQPAHGSLLGTTVTNTAWPAAHVVTRWAGADRGCSEAGFTDNTALGSLVLDGGNQSLFTFAPVGANNAMYVDRLELTNSAIGRDDSGNLTGIQILPGMKIYFAQALANGVSIAEKLNGRNDGAFCWVSGYAGFFSSTNMTYPNGLTYRVNAALVESCDIDSNGNGTVNCLDPAPITITTPPVIPPTNPPTGGTDPTNTTTIISNGLPKLLFPGSSSAGGSVLSNAFTLAQGNYSGLFYETNGITAARSGYLTVTTTARKTYSGRVVLGGLSYPFAGTFDSNGHATASITRRGLPTLTVELALDLSGADQLRGRILTSTWSAELMADRATFSKAAHPANYAGYYTMAIPPASNSAGPAGYGYGSVKIDAAGTVLWSAKLADGTVVSQKTTLSKQGVWPLYAAPHNRQGLVISWVQFTTNDAGGQVIWIKPAGTPGKLYPAGFTNGVEAIISPYRRPAARQRAVDLFNGRGKLVFSGGGLLNAFTNTIQLDVLNRASYLVGPKLSLQIVSPSGFFRGTVRNPETGKPFGFQGSLLQDGNFGAGFFINGNVSGQVYLAEPAALQ